MTDAVVVGAGVASAVLGHPGEVLDGPTAPAADFDPLTLLGVRGWRYKDRATQLGMLAAIRCIEDASLVEDTPPDHRLTVPAESVGVVASSNLGNLDTVCRTAETIATTSVTRTSPLDLPNASSNIVASSIAVHCRLRGLNVMVTNGASSGLDAAHLASVLIAAGRADRVVVVGVEPANDVVATLVGVPAPQLFDGAVAVLVESATAAAARGVTARARLGGYARRADADASVTRALGYQVPPALWLAEEATTAPAVLAGTPRRDLAAALGAASGALGVLQLVAAMRWLDNGGTGPVLATAGAAEDGMSSLLVKPGGPA